MKTIATLLAAVVVATAFTACHHPGCMDPDSFNFDPAADVDDGSCSDMHGCLGYSTGGNQSGSTGNTLGDPYYDQKMSEEVVIQRNFFQVPATVYILNEGSYDQRNAYATSDGQIYFGYHMFYYTIQNFNELAAAGILAHEWGHRVQFTYNFTQGMHNPDIELEADAFSGFYMALEKGYAWSQINGYFASTYATGDYYFNSPQHHGTPDQRLAAAYVGVEIAIDLVNNNVQNITHQDLHERIMDSLRANVIRQENPDATSNTVSESRNIANGTPTGVDIKRRPLTDEEKQRFYPRD